MKLFLDTNAYFSAFSPEPDLEPFLELKKIIDSKKIELITTEQISDEFLRGTGKRIEQSREQIASYQTEAKKLFNSDNFPKDIYNKHKADIEKIKKETEKYYEEFEIKIEKADRLISEIISSCKKIPITNEIIEKAKTRFTRGNPPKKDKGSSHGDAISWELLLENVSDDLIIVSYDPDYSEPYKKGLIINRFLKEEWFKKTGKKVVLHNTLRGFINSQEKKEVFDKSDIAREVKTAKTQQVISDLFYQNILTTSLRELDERNQRMILEVTKPYNVMASGLDMYNKINSSVLGDYDTLIKTLTSTNIPNSSLFVNVPEINQNFLPPQNVINSIDLTKINITPPTPEYIPKNKEEPLTLQ